MDNTGWWVADVLHGQGPFMLASWIFWVVFAITLHELGHGVAAIRVGDRTPIETGHMTLNPVVHMGIPSLIVFLVVGIAWGAMPVNPARMRGRHADALVAFAGPAVNLALAVLCMIGGGIILGLAAKPPEEGLVANGLEFFGRGAMLNVVLLVLNLLPIPPLDGSRILTSFSRSLWNFYNSPNAGLFSLIAILFVFFVADEFIFETAWAIAGIGIGAVAGLFG